MMKGIQPLLLVVALSGQYACTIIDKARFFELKNGEGFSKLPIKKWTTAHNYHWAKNVVAYTKKMYDSASNPVGDFIIQRYDPINIQSLFMGMIVPVFPVFLIEKDVLPNHQGRTILRLGLNYYDTCQNFLNLGNRSFYIIINGNDTLQSSYFRRDDGDCGLQWIDAGDEKIKCSISYFFDVDRPINPAKTITLIPGDAEAKRCFEPVYFSRRNHVYVEFFFPLPH